MVPRIITGLQHLGALTCAILWRAGKNCNSEFQPYQAEVSGAGAAVGGPGHRRDRPDGTSLHQRHLRGNRGEKVNRLMPCIEKLKAIPQGFMFRQGQTTARGAIYGPGSVSIWPAELEEIIFM